MARTAGGLVLLTLALTAGKEMVLLKWSSGADSAVVGEGYVASSRRLAPLFHMGRIAESRSYTFSKLFTTRLRSS